MWFCLSGNEKQFILRIRPDIEKFWTDGMWVGVGKGIYRGPSHCTFSNSNLFVLQKSEIRWLPGIDYLFYSTHSWKKMYWLWVHGIGVVQLINEQKTDVLFGRVIMRTTVIVGCWRSAKHCIRVQWWTSVPATLHTRSPTCSPLREAIEHGSTCSTRTNNTLQTVTERLLGKSLLSATFEPHALLHLRIRTQTVDVSM